MPQKSHNPRAESLPDRDPVDDRAALLVALARDAGLAVTLDGHVDEATAALLLGRSANTLRNWRGLHRPLAFRQLGGRRGRVTYAVRELARFLLDAEQERP